MDISGKIWGSTSKLFSQNNVEIFRIHGKKSGKSSIHKHKAKWSMFFIEKGSVKVVVEKNDYELVDETVLKEGQSMTIAPEEYHGFEVLEDDTVAYEFYWTEINSDDIIRKNCGSIDGGVKEE